MRMSSSIWQKRKEKRIGWKTGEGRALTSMCRVITEYHTLNCLLKRFSCFHLNAFALRFSLGFIFFFLLISFTLSIVFLVSVTSKRDSLVKPTPMVLVKLAFCLLHVMFVSLSKHSWAKKKKIEISYNSDCYAHDAESDDETLFKTWGLEASLLSSCLETQTLLKVLTR